MTDVIIVDTKTCRVIHEFVLLVGSCPNGTIKRGREQSEPLFVKYRSSRFPVLGAF
jgi:hypothetical protein